MRKIDARARPIGVKPAIVSCISQFVTVMPKAIYSYLISLKPRRLNL